VITISLILAAAVPQSMLAAADDANAAYVQCLFAASRAANAAHLSVDAFETKLASSCLAEEAALVRTGTAVMAARGEPNAASTVRREAAEARRSVVETYRKILELSRQN
jgi:hypothetical protein